MDLFPVDGSIVLYDTEFTSWPGFLEPGFKAPGRYPEVIQIGAVRIDAAGDFAERDALDILMLPRVNVKLSDYIIDLTGITQARLEKAGIQFAYALDIFLNFVGDSTPLFSFGMDGVIMRENCRLQDLPEPPLFDTEINLKAMLADAGLVEMIAKSSGLPALFGLEPEHRGHDALADARAVVRVLRYLRSEGRLA